MEHSYCFYFWNNEEFNKAVKTVKEFYLSEFYNIEDKNGLKSITIKVNQFFDIHELKQIAFNGQLDLNNLVKVD